MSHGLYVHDHPDGLAVSGFDDGQLKIVRNERELWELLIREGASATWISPAVAAERERCIQAAEAAASTNKPSLGEYERGFDDAKRAIISAIRRWKP